jgi:uncharacterized protein (DUF433 family)/DNA-binding transcriptional MerR regulator
MRKVLEFPGPRTVAAPDRTEALGFYTPAEAARIARVPLHRLRAWQHEGIIFPTLFATDTEGTETAGYTFEAVVYLRLLRMLRERHTPLAKAVQAVKHLRKRFGPPGPCWEEARIFIQGHDVFVHSRDEWDVTVPTRSGQKAATMLLGEEFAQLRERADALLVPRQFWPSVEIDPEVRSGLPVIRGTTMPTAVPYAMRRRGESLRSIQTAYPHLSLSQIKGAIAFERFLDAEAA